jgi:tetratricopeptide (TPR) repeat protein
MKIAFAHTGRRFAVEPESAGRWERLAVRHFLTALQLDPNQAEANYYVGLILSGQRRYAEAREKFDRALRANPDFYKAHLGMVNLCIEERNLADAERHAQAASRINPKDAAVHEMFERLAKAKSEAKP